MAAQSQTDASKAAINTQTVRALHDLVYNAVSRLSKKPDFAALHFKRRVRFERGPDGHFRKKRNKRIPILFLTDEWLRSLPDYQACIESLKCDAVIGRHLDRLVGTRISTTRIDANKILTSLIYAMFDDEGRLTFTDEKFYREWQVLAGFFDADQFAFKVVGLLPQLALATIPLKLNDELVFDSLTEDEVTRCCRVGVIRSESLIFGSVAVGVRRTTYLPKMIRRDDEPFDPPTTEGAGSFGRRRLSRSDLIVDDVLSALRLFKHTQSRTVGRMSWTDSLWLNGHTSYQVLGQWPYGGNFELSDGDAGDFLELWQLAENGAARFDFSIRRFSSAFDRRLLDDRIVDLVIAAEALFLSDLGKTDRGELKFRFALRAAKFIERTTYSEHDVFRVMSEAYDVRSAIVHGGSPNKTRLPDNQSADSRTFIDAVEDLVRLGLCKALRMKRDGNKIRDPEYWKCLLLSQAKPSVNPTG